MRAVQFQSFYAIALMLVLRCPISLGWRSFKIIYSRVEFEANPKLVDVKIDIQNKSDTALNVVINTLEILDDIEVTATVALETQNGNYTNFISRTLNFCKLMKNIDSEPLSRMFYQDLLRHGKLFKECPIQKGTYTLQNYKIDEELLPSFLPEAKFKFSLLCKLKTEKIYEGVLYGRVDKSKGFNNLKKFSLG